MAAAGDALDHVITIPGRHRDELPGPPPQITVATLPLPAGFVPDPRLVLLRAPDSPRAASYRVLRHYLTERGNPKIIAVSSARPREGKTTCAINLALALGECSRARVLLIEANLRSPQLAVMFGFTPPWCFAEQIAAHRSQPTLPWAVIEPASLGLHLAAINPAARGMLVDVVAFTGAMEALRRAEYDHIVVDTPAVLGSAEVNLVQDGVDGVLITTFGGRSTASDLRRTIEQLSPRKVVGVVHFEG